MPMFLRRPNPLLRPEWLIVGLGNPGAEYRGTRHNLGFELIDELAQRHKIKLGRGEHQARTGLGSIGSVPVLLAKPLTYMNLSGRAVAALAKKYELKPDRVLVIADDVDLDVGRTRLKPRGSSGGHNGHKSIIASLGTQDYPRIKIGIGSAGQDKTVDHVLSPFAKDEIPIVADALKRAADGVEAAVERGVDAGMTIVNVKARDQD